MRAILPPPLTISACALLAACAPTATKAPPRPDWQGHANYQRIQPPAWEKPYNVPKDARAHGTFLKLNPAPTYPAALVDKALPPVVIVARLSVDVAGHVHAVWVSQYQGDTAFRQAFEDAVRTAAMTWDFAPLTFTNEISHNNQPPTIKTTRKPFSVYFRFHFKVVNGKPVTSSGRTHA